MKRYFKIIRKNFAHLGISKNQPRLNGKSAMTFLILSLSTISGIVYLYFEANTFLEYTINIYETAMVLGCCIGFTVILFNKEKLFKLMNNFVTFYDESKCKAFGKSMLSLYNCDEVSPKKYTLFRTEGSKSQRNFGQNQSASGKLL